MKVSDFILAALVFLSGWIIFGYFFEEYEPLKAALIQGELSAPPYDQWLTNWNFTFVPALSFLAQKFPTLPVYGIWNLTGIFLIILLLTHLLRKITGNLSLTFLITVVTCLFIGNNLQNINNNRIAIFICGLSMVLFFYKRDTALFKKLGIILLFLTGALIRVETSPVAVVLASLFMLTQIRSVRSTLRIVYPFVIISGLVLLFFKTGMDLKDSYGKMIEHKYCHSFKDKFTITPISDMRTAYDSIRYEAYMNNLYTDTAHITPSFLDSILIQDSYREHLFSINNLHSAVQQVSRLSGRYIYHLCFIVLVTCITFYICRRRQVFLYSALLLLCGYSILLTISFLVNIQERVFSPILCLTLLLIILVNLVEIKASENPGSRYLLFIPALLILLQPVKDLLSLRQEYLDLEKANTALSSELNAYTNEGYKLVIFDSREEIFTVNPAALRNAPYLANLHPLNLWYYSFHPFAGRRSMQYDQYSTINYKSMYAFLTREDHLILISTGERLDLFKRYLNIVYHLDIHFAPFTVNGAIQPGRFVVSKP